MTSITPVSTPLDFLTQLHAAVKKKTPSHFVINKEDIESRRCVITRSPSYYGRTNSVTIEWEGSPAKWSIYFNRWLGCLVVSGGIIYDPECIRQADVLIKQFLAAHPAKPDNSTVWIKSCKRQSNE